MSLKTRRILFIIFILSFLIITPLVISYAAGYKFVFGKKVFQKTGMLILDTEPEGAKIYLNEEPRTVFLKKYFSGRESNVITPAKIKNLLPGEYNVRIELPGYEDWQKKLEIKPGIATFAEDIYLFKRNVPSLLIDGEFKKILPSPDSKHLAAAGNKGINLFNIETEKNIFVDFENEMPELNYFLWSPDSEKILINNIVINTNSPSEKLNIENYIGKNYLNIQWHGSNELYYYISNSNEGAIYSFNLETKDIKRPAAGNKITKFLAKENDLFFIGETDKSANLIINEINSGTRIRNIELPPIADYEFINQSHKLINLYDKKRQTLYLIDPFIALPLKETINNVKYAYWINEDKLLYANDFEIWLADFSAGQRKKVLITRISEEIKNIIWHKSDNYIIYSSGNAIHTIELDDREKRNTIELIKLNNIASLFLNKKGNTLYFYAEIGNQKGLYKLIIQ